MGPRAFAVAGTPLCLGHEFPNSQTPKAPQGDQTVCVGVDRMAALAEGGNETKIHTRVNAMIEDEFDKVESKNVHAGAREYLKGIEGGTASLDARQLAEA